MAKVLFLSNHFITLYAFRKELIKRVLEEGHEAYVSLPPSEDNLYFESLGCHVIKTKVDRRGINPFKDLLLIFTYYKMMRNVNPDIVFSYTIKPNIYGCIANRFTKFKQICNITGTGTTFLYNGIVSKVCRLLYKCSVKYSYKVFFQNEGDRDIFIKYGLVRNNYDMLPGSGVNLIEHPFAFMPSVDHLNFLYIGRVMKLKGIIEYLECAKRIRGKHPNTTFYIAGWNEEPAYMKKVKEAEELGFVIYIGFRKDLKDWIRMCHCMIHTAHGGEGISNVLLECTAMGRICIAPDINGCREVIENGVSGYLFQKGNVDDLVGKVETFISLSQEQMTIMARIGRKRVEQLFDRNMVVNKYIQEINDLGNE